MTINNNLITRHDAMMATDVDIENWTSRNNAEAWWACRELLKEIRANIMNIQEAPKKKGKWIVLLDEEHKDDRESGMFFEGVSFKCSECGEYDDTGSSKYCKGCGAKMEEADFTWYEELQNRFFGDNK